MNRRKSEVRIKIAVRGRKVKGQQGSLDRFEGRPTISDNKGEMERPKNEKGHVGPTSRRQKTGVASGANTFILGGGRGGGTSGTANGRGALVGWTKSYHKGARD